MQVWSTKNRSDVKVDFVNINRFFFNQDAESPTLDDVVGTWDEIDYSWDDASTCGRESAMFIAEQSFSYEPNFRLTPQNNLRHLDFYVSSHNNKYRVFEIWTRDTPCGSGTRTKGEEIFDEVNGHAYYETINEAQRLR